MVMKRGVNYCVLALSVFFRPQPLFVINTAFGAVHFLYGFERVTFFAIVFLPTFTAIPFLVNAIHPLTSITPHCVKVRTAQYFSKMLHNITLVAFAPFYKKLVHSNKKIIAGNCVF